MIRTKDGNEYERFYLYTNRQQAEVLREHCEREGLRPSAFIRRCLEDCGFIPVPSSSLDAKRRKASVDETHPAYADVRRLRKDGLRVTQIGARLKIPYAEINAILAMEA